MRAAVDCPITTSGAAPLILDGFRRVRRSTFTEGAIMERAEYNRHSRARVAETAKDASRHATPCNAGRAGAHRPSEALHPTRSSDVLPRIARERVPTTHMRGSRGVPSLPHITIISAPPIFRLEAKLYHPPSLQTPTMLCERRPLDSRTHPSFRCLHHRDSGLRNENSTLL